MQKEEEHRGECSRRVTGSKQAHGKNNQTNTVAAGRNHVGLWEKKDKTKKQNKAKDKKKITHETNHNAAGDKLSQGAGLVRNKKNCRRTGGKKQTVLVENFQIKNLMKFYFLKNKPGESAEKTGPGGLKRQLVGESDWFTGSLVH